MIHSHGERLQFLTFLRARVASGAVQELVDISELTRFLAECANHVVAGTEVPASLERRVQLHTNRFLQRIPFADLGTGQRFVLVEQAASRDSDHYIRLDLPRLAMRAGLGVTKEFDDDTIVVIV